jgi:uncharacterized protein involved in exopolysaccharide biosynthesis
MATESAPEIGGWRDFLGIVWTSRRPIVLVSVIAAIVTLGAGFFLPRYYRADATLLPETEGSNLSGITQFADLAQLTGMIPANGELSRLYPAILESETVLTETLHKRFATEDSADSVQLITYFDLDEDSPEEEMEKALERMHDLLETGYDSKTGIVSVTIEMPEPQLAAAVLNTIVAELDRFMRVKRVTGASEQLRWITSRLVQVEEELKGAEDSLRNFRDRNRRIEDSPGLLLQQQRLIRRVEISSTTFIELKKQYELAKIEEIKNTSLVSVLDAARAPARPERPKKLLNAVVMFVLAFTVLSGYYIIRTLYAPRVLTFFRSFKG